MALNLQSPSFMPETILGDLAQVKLFDILKPLLTEKKTGLVSIKGKMEGEIFLKVGDIIHAKTDHFTGENAFFVMMGWMSGRIAFNLGVSPRERTIFITTEQLLLNWSSRKEEFEKIKEVIPSSHAIFRLSLKQDGKEKNISSDQWNVLALSNGMKTISEIAKALGWDEYKTLKTVFHLLQMGLLEKADDRGSAKRKLVKGDFFSVLEVEFKKVMGPVAPFVIDDKLVEFGESKETFPEERALLFMEALGEEIPNPQKRNEFLRVAMKLLGF